jgi:hypothetical protein
MARRRIGSSAARRIAAAPSLEAGLDMLSGTAYAAAAKSRDLAAAEHAVRAEVLWQLRVLAGWMPPPAAPMARALAGGFEARNIVGHYRRLAGSSAEPAFRLGTVATAWPRLSMTRSVEQLGRELSASVWTVPDAAVPRSAAELSDLLTVIWMRRLAVLVPGAERWTAGRTALLAARLILAERRDPPTELVRAAVPLLGTGWAAARDAAGLRAVVPATARWALTGVSAAETLWRAEAELRRRTEAAGFRELRAAMQGPSIAAGAFAVLAMDAWRLRAALACAESGHGVGEVLDVVA